MSLIFVTAGSQEPFDRLIKAVDEIALQLKGTTMVVQALQSQYKAKNFEVTSYVPPVVFENYIEKADLIVGHAGMGTVISSLVKNKPILVMPRLMKYNEIRNEHQLATTKMLDKLGYIYVAYNEQELKTKLLSIWPGNLKSLHFLGSNASRELISSLEDFINSKIGKV